MARRTPAQYKAEYDRRVARARDAAAQLGLPQPTTSQATGHARPGQVTGRELTLLATIRSRSESYERQQKAAKELQRKYGKARRVDVPADVKTALGKENWAKVIYGGSV